MKLLFAFAGVLGLVLSVHIMPASAQANGGGGTIVDAGLNSMQVVLSLLPESRRPSCTGEFIQKKLRFCPLVAKCPSDKPFCVTRHLRREGSRSVSRSCVCSNTTETVEDTIGITSGTGRVQGQIVRTNACGGAAMIGDDCRRAYVGPYTIRSAAGNKYSGTTNEDGIFTRSLAVGQYTLQVPTLGPDGSRPAEKVFAVQKNRTVEVRLDVDSGIRFGDLLPQ